MVDMDVTNYFSQLKQVQLQAKRDRIRYLKTPYVNSILYDMGGTTVPLFESPKKDSGKVGLLRTKVARNMAKILMIGHYDQDGKVPSITVQPPSVQGSCEYLPNSRDHLPCSPDAPAGDPLLPSSPDTVLTSAGLSPCTVEFPSSSSRNASSVTPSPPASLRGSVSDLSVFVDSENDSNNRKNHENGRNDENGNRTMVDGFNGNTGEGDEAVATSSLLNKDLKRPRPQGYCINTKL